MLRQTNTVSQLFFGAPPAHKGLKLGIEIEVELAPSGESYVPGKGSWSVARDNSLRNGLEYVSKPLERSEVDKAVETLLKQLKKVKSVTTKRCGLHVHLNALHQDFNFLQKHAVLYSLLEPTIYETYAVGRDDSNFTVPLFDATYQARQMRDAFRNMAKYKSRATRLHQTEKYAAYNLSALARFGTIEMRQPYCTLDAKKVLNWVHFLIDMYEAAEQYESPVEIMEHYTTLGLREWQRFWFGSSPKVDPVRQRRARLQAILMITEPWVEPERPEWHIDIEGV